ncbi:MAG: hypothetical protein AAF750_15520 [Planctomycetota bacterium]
MPAPMKPDTALAVMAIERGVPFPVRLAANDAVPDDLVADYSLTVQLNGTLHRPATRLEPVTDVRLDDPAIVEDAAKRLRIRPERLIQALLDAAHNRITKSDTLSTAPATNHQLTEQLTHGQADIAAKLRRTRKRGRVSCKPRGRPFVITKQEIKRR